MFRAIKVSVTLGAAVLIAAPGCSLPNLLCNHSSPSEETVVVGNSSQYVGDYSDVSSDCGCGCDAGVVDSGMYDAGTVDSVIVSDDDRYIIGTPQEEAAEPVAEGALISEFQSTPTVDATLGGSGSKVLDVVKPPVELKTPVEKSLPGNLLP